METYETLSGAIDSLRNQGYTLDFNLEENRIVCTHGKYMLEPEEFEIDKSFRFDVDEDPSDQAVLYAISSHNHQIKGLLVNGYGNYSDPLTDKMIKKLK